MSILTLSLDVEIPNQQAWAHNQRQVGCRGKSVNEKPKVSYYLFKTTKTIQTRYNSDLAVKEKNQNLV